MLEEPIVPNSAGSGIPENACTIRMGSDDGNRLQTWLVDGLVAAELAVYGHAGPLRCTHVEEPRPGCLRVDAPWNRPESFALSAGRNYLDFRNASPGAFPVTGDTVFDSSVVASSLHPQWLFRVLDQGIRGRLLEIADLVGPPETSIRFSVRAGGARVVFECFRGFTKQPHHRDRCLEHMVVVLRRLRGEAIRALEILDTRERIGEARCPVCAEELRGGLFQCGRCRTLHHEECFYYAGICATYACLSTEGSVVPRSEAAR